MFIAQSDSLQQSALALFQTDHGQLAKIKLHLKGTAFQLKVLAIFTQNSNGSTHDLWRACKID